MSTQRVIFWLRGRDVHWRADLDQCKKLWRSLAVQADATVRSRVWMNVTLVKSVGWSKLTPVTHRITNVAPRSATGGRNHAIALHTESVRSGTFAFLF